MVVIREDLLNSFASFFMAVILTAVQSVEEDRIQLLWLCMPCSLNLSGAVAVRPTAIGEDATRC